MTLVSTEDLKVKTVGFSGRDWRRLDQYICKHGAQNIVVESGWTCYGSLKTCICCGRDYCYTDNFDDIMSEDHCRFCMNNKEYVEKK